MLYGASRVYTEQLGRGEPYTALRPVVAIWICERDVFGEGGQLSFQMREARSGAVLHGDLRVEVLQLAQWERDREELLASGVGRWYGFFREAEGWSEVPAALRHPTLEGRRWTCCGSFGTASWTTSTGRG